MKRSLVSTVAAGLAILSLSVGVGATAAAPTKAKSPVLLVGITNSIDSLNPFIAIYQSALNVLQLEYEPLTQWSATNTEIGGLAQSWSVSDGGRVWTYHLRPGLKWSDGVPITAADAVWTYEAIMKHSALAAANGSLLVGVKSVSAPNAETFRLTLTGPQAPDPALGMPIVPEHVWSKLSSPATFADTSNVVGSGPFLVTAYHQNQSVSMKANPLWYGGKTKMSGVDFVEFDNGDAATEALRSGAIDVTDGFTPAQYSSLRSVSGMKVVTPLSEHYWSIDVNPGAQDKQRKPIGNGNAALHSLLVRQAIQDMINQQVLVQKVLDGNGTYGPGIIPPAYPRYYLPNSETRPGGVAVANKLMDEAGYKLGAHGLRVNRLGQAIHLRFTYVSGDVQQQEVVSYVIPWLKEIGIAVSANPESSSQTATDLGDGNYDLMYDGWGVSPDPDFMLYINTCANLPNANGSGNTTAYNWCSPAFDKLYHQQHVALDQGSRATYVRQALNKLYNAAVVDVLFYDQDLSAYRADRVSFDVPTSFGVTGNWAVIGASPAAAGAKSGGSSPVIWIVLGVVVLLGVGLAVRRRLNPGEEE